MDLIIVILNKSVIDLMLWDNPQRVFVNRSHSVIEFGMMVGTKAQDVAGEIQTCMPSS